MYLESLRVTGYRRIHAATVRPDIKVAATIARDWLTDHERYTSGDHVNLTGLTPGLRPRKRA